MIKRFITEHDIDLRQYEPARYRSFNDFFIRLKKSVSTHSNLILRRDKSGRRPAVVVRLTEDATFQVKDNLIQSPHCWVPSLKS